MRKLAGLVILTVTVALMSGCGSKEEIATAGGSKGLPREANSAELGMAPLAGDMSKQILLKDFAGQVILVDFWATWCPPCRYELPYLNKIYGELKDQGFTLLGATVDQGSADQVADKVKAFNLTYPVGLAGQDFQSHFGGVRVVPTKFLLDKSGEIRQKYEGVVPEEQLKSDIEELLAE